MYIRVCTKIYVYMYLGIYVASFKSIRGAIAIEKGLGKKEASDARLSKGAGCGMSRNWNGGRLEFGRLELERLHGDRRIGMSGMRKSGRGGCL